MLLRFDVMMYSNLRNENSGAGYTNVYASRIWPTDRRYPPCIFKIMCLEKKYPFQFCNN